MDAEEKLKFVTIELSRKQVDMEHTTISKTNNKAYVRVYAPAGGVLAGGVFFYPRDSIKTKKDDEDRLYFVRPEGTELTVYYSSRVEMPETPEEKYHSFTKTIKIEDLKAMYEEERQAFIEKKNAERESKSADWVSFTVPTSWGSSFSSEKGSFVSVSIPVNGSYYSFIVQQERFKESSKAEGMSYFSFPRVKRDDPDTAYEVQLKKSERQSDGSYKDTAITMSSEELKEHVDAALKSKEFKDMFVGTNISEKLIHPFKSRDGRNLVEVAVPIYEAGSDKADFYKIVVPEKRIMDGGREGQKYLSLFIKGPDGEEYKFSAKKGVRDTAGNWTDETRELTSKEVIAAFEESAERYRAEKESQERSIDEMNGSPEPAEDPQQSARRVRHGR